MCGLVCEYRAEYRESLCVVWLACFCTLLVWWKTTICTFGITLLLIFNIIEDDACCCCCGLVVVFFISLLQQWRVVLSWSRSVEILALWEVVITSFDNILVLTKERLIRWHCNFVVAHIKWTCTKTNWSLCT